MAVSGSIEVKFSGRSRLPATIGGLVAVLAVLTLLIAWPRSTISRQDAVRAALHAPWNQQLPTDLVIAVKLIHRFHWDRVWVVVLKGELIPASMPGGPPATYTVEVIRDSRPAVVEIYVSGGPGERPANWDQLMDLE